MKNKKKLKNDHSYKYLKKSLNNFYTLSNNEIDNINIYI